MSYMVQFYSAQYKLTQDNKTEKSVRHSRADAIVWTHLYACGFFGVMLVYFNNTQVLPKNARQSQVAGNQKTGAE
jgi:hypothetical protein